MGDQIGQSANPGHSTQICGRLTLQEQRQLPRPQPGQDPRNFDGGLASIKTSETLPEPEKDEVSPSTTIVCSSEGTLPASHKHFQKPTFELHGIRRCSESSGPTQSAGWVPSILRAGPILGLIALVFATLQVVASYAVLKASNGDAVANWKYQPTVYLAILTAISNKAVAFAMIQGTVITFWLRALRGTTLVQLHRDWAQGLFVWKALSAGRHFTLLALACICTTFVALLDGPLLQRASSVQPDVPDIPLPLAVSISPEVPSYYTGRTIYSDNGGVAADVSSSFFPVVQDFVYNNPIRGAILGCPGTCTTTVLAPALAVDHCESFLQYRNFTAPFTEKEQEVLEITGGGFLYSADRAVFGAKFYLYNGTNEVVMTHTFITDESVRETCVGHVNVTECYLVSAIAEYPVTISNGIITFAESLSYPKIVSRANNTAITRDTIDEFGLNEDAFWTKTTLSGIYSAIQPKYGMWEGIAPINGPGTQPLLSPIDQAYFPLRFLVNYEDYDHQIDCAPAWRDPKEAIMAGLNELMFRTGVLAAQQHDEVWLKSRIDSGLDIHYNVSGVRQSSINVFSSDFSYFAGAAAVQLFTISMILFTFYGWWRLGRHVTFSPLELAKAFDAPLLQDVESNLSGRRIARSAGSREVQYGFLQDETRVNYVPGRRLDEKLVIAEKQKIRKPVETRRTLRDYYVVIQQMFHVRGRRSGRVPVGHSASEEATISRQGEVV